MKKLIYILIVVAISAVTIYSCTEQDVKPGSIPGGGSISDPKK